MSGVDGAPYLAPVPWFPLPARLAVLLSGRGSNFEALAAACARGELPARIVLVLADRADAAGLEKASALGLRSQLEERRAGEARSAHEERLAGHLEAAGTDIVCLAGFMRVLSSAFVARFERRIVNVHPSLLPAFPGLHTHRRALEAGVKLHGATVHLVTPALDSGPIVAQAAVPVLAGDTEETLSQRVLAAEHRIYPQAVRWLVEERLEVLGDVVRIRGAGVGTDCIVSPRDPS